ncbi:MAG: hypothetical protein HY080_08760 [Gammaproteobacteria bacterium]|nr:hypothetical protein [Gammaproteobacteria bacterium]
MRDENFHIPKNDPRFERDKNLQTQEYNLVESYRITEGRFMIKLKSPAGKILCFDVPEKDMLNDFDNKNWRYVPSCH